MRRTLEKTGSGLVWSTSPDCLVPPLAFQAPLGILSHPVVPPNLLNRLMISLQSSPLANPLRLLRDNRGGKKVIMSAMCQPMKSKHTYEHIRNMCSPASLFSRDWSSSDTLRKTSSKVVSITPKLVSARESKLFSKAWRHNGKLVNKAKWEFEDCCVQSLSLCMTAFILQHRMKNELYLEVVFMYTYSGFLKDIPKLICGCLLPFASFSVKMIPHRYNNIEFLGRSVNGW